MHLRIQSDGAHRLATELARLTGESLTTSVTLALRERLERVQRRALRQSVAPAGVGGRRAANAPPVLVLRS